MESNCASAGFPLESTTCDLLRGFRQLRLDFRHIGSRPRQRIEQQDWNTLALRIYVCRNFAKRSSG